MPEDLVNDNWFPMEVAEVLKYETVVHQEIPGTMERTATIQSPPGKTRDYLETNFTRKQQQVPTVSHEQFLGTIHNLFTHF